MLMGLVLVRFICDQSMHNLPNCQESDNMLKPSRFPVKCKHRFRALCEHPADLREQLPITTNNDPFVVADAQLKDSDLPSSFLTPRNRGLCSRRIHWKSSHPLQYPLQCIFEGTRELAKWWIRWSALVENFELPLASRSPQTLFRRPFETRAPTTVIGNPVLWEARRQVPSGRLDRFRVADQLDNDARAMAISWAYAGKYEARGHPRSRSVG
jgi:hypothetical protein